MIGGSARGDRLAGRFGRSSPRGSLQRRDRQVVEPEFDHPRPERLIAGNPQRTTWNHYTNASGEVFAGIWSSGVGAWRIAMGEREDELFFDSNGFIQRPSSIGTERTREYDAVYIGYNGDGHFGRVNLTVSGYLAYGDQSHGVFTAEKSDIEAGFVAAEASMDFDWIRVRASGAWASGDDDPYDDKSQGYDAIFENPIFAGADTSYWVRQSVPFIGGGRAIGINGNLFAGLNVDSDFNFQNRRATRVAVPLTEYQWSAAANITYVPAYGKFAGFSDFIFHYDFFVLAGGGVVSTRPIAVVDPDNRTFSFKPKPAGHIGGGLRIFFNRWLAATIEVSDYIFSDELENATVDQSLKGTCGKPAAQCDDTWIKGSSLTNNVQAQLGFSIFLPFSWEYRLPK